jgi:hypothetical protein
MRFLALIFLLAFPAASFAATDPLDALRDEALSFFGPMVGNVVALLNDEVIMTEPGETSGMKKGMRLIVKREGEPFVHPITKELIGRTETPVGIAEVVETGGEGSTLKLIGGEARPGDTIRLSSARVRAVYCQTKGFDWMIAEEYYWRLRDSGRFELLEVPPVSGGDAEIISLAREANAEAAIVLSMGGPAVRQRLLWAEDGKEFSSVELTLDRDFLEGLKLGEEFFRKRKR